MCPCATFIAFTAVMNETIKPYLAAKGNSPEDVDRMHRAWCKSIQMQLALWVGPYTDGRQPSEEWGGPLRARAVALGLYKGTSLLTPHDHFSKAIHATLPRAPGSIVSRCARPAHANAGPH